MPPSSFLFPLTARRPIWVLQAGGMIVSPFGAQERVFMAVKASENASF